MLNIEGKNTVLEVSPLQPTSAATPTELRERRDVRGAQGWQVNGHGYLYEHMRRKYPYTKAGRMPVIYLGERYCGPLLPAYEHHGEVFLDEIVALTFHGLPQIASLKWWPSTGYALGDNGHVANGMLVHHVDGDPDNCRRDNVAWTADGEFFEAVDEKLLRPTGLTARFKPPGVFPFSRRDPLFTESDSVVGWQPTEGIRPAA